ncbi:MAG: DNA cytosine methyltransferase [Clostridia bacterium]|nr:DNA cytosine methyltransferase [Clostridia bacterium]
MQKIIGIPQNRERVFIVSIRNDVAKSNFCFPEKIQLRWKLKDFLQDIVDEKYYLSEKAIGRLIKKNNKLIRNKDNPNVSSCIIAGYHKMDGRNNQYIADNNSVKRIIGLYDKEDRKHQAGSVYNTEGLSPTLTTMVDGGHKQPFVLVKEGTIKGYSEATKNDSINISYPNNIKKRGRVGKEISQTILTSPNMAVLEDADKPICLNNTEEKVSIQDRIYDTNGIATSILASNFRSNIAERRMFNVYNNKEIKDIAPTQTTACGNTTSTAAILVAEDGKSCMRIRKLTPLECWRLMRV